MKVSLSVSAAGLGLRGCPADVEEVFSENCLKKTPTATKELDLLMTPV